MLYPGFADTVKTVHVSEANGSVPLVSELDLVLYL